MSLLAIKKKSNENSLIIPKRIYIVNAEPEPFSDEEWFANAKQHESYDPDRLPSLQITIPGGHPSQSDHKMRKGLMNEPNTPTSILVSIRSGKEIKRSNHSWICLSTTNVFWLANYKDLGLVHTKKDKQDGSSRQSSMVSRGFSKTVRDHDGKRVIARENRRQRYYLIPVPTGISDALYSEIIRHTFG